MGKDCNCKARKDINKLIKSVDEINRNKHSGVRVRKKTYIIIFRILKYMIYALGVLILLIFGLPIIIFLFFRKRKKVKNGK